MPYFSGYYAATLIELAYIPTNKNQQEKYQWIKLLILQIRKVAGDKYYVDVR